MEIYCITAADGRIVAADLAQVAPDWVAVNLPDAAMCQIFDYRLVGGQLMHDPLPQPEPRPTAQELLRADVDYLLIAEMAREGLL